MYSLSYIGVILYEQPDPMSYLSHTRLITVSGMASHNLGWPAKMAYGSSLAKQAGAPPTVDELGRMTQSSSQSKIPAPATLSHWTFAPLTLTKPPVALPVPSMSRRVLKQDAVMESNSNVKLPEFAMPRPLSNRVKLQYAVTSLLLPSKAIPSNAALSMKMSP